MHPRTEGESAPVLEVVSLTKRYAGQPAIADVDLAVRPGEVLGLIGPNGAGKTTLLESIAGLLPVDAGCVTWNGHSLATQQAWLASNPRCWRVRQRRAARSPTASYSDPCCWRACTTVMSS